MSVRDVDAIFYVRKIPEIRYEDGHFHVAYDVGTRARFEFVFSPNTFIRMRQTAAKIVDAFHETGGKVSSLRRGKSANGNH
jgi:hypothetical protein